VNADAVRGLLLVVSGPSGVGKGTLLNLLLEKRNDCVFSVSATTRAPRPGEIDGVHYYFLDSKVFSEWVEEDRFLEWNRVFDRFYGTPLEPVEQHLASGTNVVLDIDVQGGSQVLRTRPDSVSVFIAPPCLDTLANRLQGRGTETEEQIRLRLLTAKSELKALHDYKYLVINDDLQTAVGQINSILEAERCRYDRLKHEQRLPDFD
jgi:guanylate kinase